MPCIFRGMCCPAPRAAARLVAICSLAAKRFFAERKSPMDEQGAAPLSPGLAPTLVHAIVSGCSRTRGFLYSIFFDEFCLNTRIKRTYFIPHLMRYISRLLREVRRVSVRLPFQHDGGRRLTNRSSKAVSTSCGLRSLGESLVIGVLAFPLLLKISINAAT